MARPSIADIAAKREAAMSTKSDEAIEPSRDVEIPRTEASAKSEKPKTLPKVTLYAHEKVLKAIRLVAVEDGVQAQEILRAAVRDYLATRGHHFTDLTTGK